ncbi:MAG: MFS transporter [Deltaproteobacteria bacterium]|nr:MFS transporter [Deltaproteobacteria bacterium]
MDVSSEMVHGLLPVFLVSALGASMTSVGVLEGLAEGVVLLVKVISGPLSDWLGRRKPLVVIGYTVGALSKPLFALAGGVPFVYFARLLDRTGKGVREAPRDALVADLTPSHLRGRAFGLRQSLDTIGAVVGPLLAILLMIVTGGSYRLVFWLATIPGILAVVTLLYGVRESASPAPLAEKHRRIRWEDLRQFHPSFWVVVASGALFELARFSEAFLVLRAKDFGLAFGMAPAVLIVMNVVYAFTAYPVGHWSDRVRREWFLLLGVVFLIAADLVLVFANSLVVVFLGILLWGLHLACTQGTLAALVADTCPPSRRGSAYGLFNLFSAVALLVASALAGVLWDWAGARATFGAGAGLSFVSLIVFGIRIRKWKA